MTPPPTQTPPPALDPATLAAMQSAAVNAVPPHPGASEADTAAQRKGTLEFLAALRPSDPVQAMLAVHIIASHYAAMECFRSAARGDLSMNMHLRTLGKAVSLCRMIERSMRELWRLQGVPVVRAAAARPAVGAAVRAEPVVAVAAGDAPVRAPVVENRHQRHRRERAERHQAAVAQRAGAGAGAVEMAMRERVAAEAAARAVGAGMTVAA